MNSAADIWSKVLSLMEADMTATTIHTWFDDTVALSLDEDKFILHTPSDFKRDIILSRYLPPHSKALHELFSADFQVVVLGAEELEKYQNSRRPKEDGFLPGTEEYTFERFVVGSSNKFAHAAARAVADHPALNYNPLFIYGESGLGKTHLLLRHRPQDPRRPSGLPHRLHQGRRLHQRAHSGHSGRPKSGVPGEIPIGGRLLMDDVQFIAGKDSTMEEMFHTFNTLYETRKQIVFTADRPPKEMLKLEDRLKTRFEWGLIADIQPPDYETRMAIIKNKAIRMGVELPEAVLQYVAENITANVRQIEGTVNKIMALRDLEGSNIDAATVTRAVRDMFKDPSDIMPTSDVIIEEVCNFYNIDNSACGDRGGPRIRP